MTPRPGVPLVDQKNNLIPDEVRQNPNSNAGQLRYLQYVSRLVSSIKQEFMDPDIDVEVVDYLPNILTRVELERLVNGEITGQEVAFKLGDGNQEVGRGKILIQYRPANKCEAKAAWRVWFEGRENRTAEWIPKTGQYFHLQRRDTTECEGDISSELPQVSTTAPSGLKSTTISGNEAPENTKSKQPLAGLPLLGGGPKVI
jgi:hypothetical protein